VKVLVLLAVGLVVGIWFERLVGGGRRRRRGRFLGLSALAMVVLLLAGTVGAYLWANSVFDKIEKVDVSAELRHGGSGTNYLLVGADNGSGGDPSREGVDGIRSDTIMILNVQGSHARMMSLNRDLWVQTPEGDHGRINGTYNKGPENLIKTIWLNYQIPIDRYIEIDFTSFAGLVDAFGGIDVNFPQPALDRASGLVVGAGDVHLDGKMALAYVRSRHYTEVIDGKEVPQGGLPDVNRTQRQQTFLKAIMAKVGDSKNPMKLMSAASKMSAGLRIDSKMTMLDAARFAWRMGKLNPEPVVLPVTPRTTSGGAAVLDLGPGADAILATFR
jgi:LCP family protein required for cell wall assembly